MKLTVVEILKISDFINYADIKRLKFILDAINDSVKSGGEVLDVGCGNGIITKSVGKAGFNVLGVDISQEAINKAQSGNDLQNVKFAVVSAEELALKNTQYDAVICSEVLEHLHHPELLLKVLYNALKDDGVLIVSVPNGMGPREVLITKPIIALEKKDNFLWKLIKKVKSSLGYNGTTVQSDAADLTHIQFFTKTSLEVLADDNSFFISKMGKVNFLENVFPFSFLARRSKFLQKLDCKIADALPYGFTCGFVSIWKKKL